MVSHVAFAPQVVVRLIPRAHALTTQVNGSMDMFESAWNSALCRHWVTPEHDSVADPDQPPAGLQASHHGRNSSTVLVLVIFDGLHLAIDLLMRL